MLREKDDEGGQEEREAERKEGRGWVEGGEGRIEYGTPSVTIRQQGRQAGRGRGGRETGKKGGGQDGRQEGRHGQGRGRCSLHHVHHAEE